MSATNHWQTTSHRRWSTARYTFTGRGIAVVAPRGPGRGRIRIYLDGVYRGTVDTYRSHFLPRLMVFVKAYASTGTHTIVLRVEGTSGRPVFSLDGFIVLH